jgi:capsular polysaccharide biosynthesis protein
MDDWHVLDEKLAGVFGRYYSVAPIESISDSCSRLYLMNTIPWKMETHYDLLAFCLSTTSDDKNIFHFIFKTLPKLEALDHISQELAKSIPLLFGYEPTEIQKEILSFLALTNPVFSLGDQNNIYAKQSVKIKRLLNWIDYRKSPDHAIQYVYERFQKNIEYLRQDHFPRKIYINRNDGKNANRLMVNANEVERVLMERGYVSLSMSNYSFRQQAAFFHNADSIIFEHGAAGAFLIFCNRSVHILELLSPKNCISSDHSADCYKDLCNTLGLTYQRLLGNIVQHKEQISFSIDVSILESKIT